MPASGWCLARRIAGDAPGGELGFRFGEPLDLDGDGNADVAAGARFKLRRETYQNGSAAAWAGWSGASAGATRKLREWDGDLPDGLFGHWVLPVADLGPAGAAGVVIAAPNARVNDLPKGVLVARSAVSGEEFWNRSGPGAQAENFGWDLSPAGDQNGDARSDLFVGAPSLDGGRVYLLSNKDGALLQTYEPPQQVRSFGWFVARLGDLDGDGRADLIAGAPFEMDGARAVSGGAHVLSSASGRQLYHWNGSGALSGFGEVVAALGDLDGDGKGEIAVAAPRTDDATRALPGEVFIYSGATGKELGHWSGKQPGELFGRMVVAAGDLDADGIDDVAIGAPWHRRDKADKAEKAGRVELRSGRSGAVIAEFFGDQADCWFGWHIRRAPDPEQLGRPALLIGSLRHPVDGHAGVGVLDLYVLRRGQLQGTITDGARRSDIR
ncbi:MAG: FG-GAP repeat protein [Deltaproteobacteria bacterium]|nr:FG-GAP repeat protein [Deltaproteobacteria bacterium]